MLDPPKATCNYKPFLVLCTGPSGIYFECLCLSFDVLCMQELTSVTLFGGLSCATGESLLSTASASKCEYQSMRNVCF